MNLVDALRPLADFFGSHGITWHIGGSVASSVHGSPRATNDIDLVVDLRHEHVAALCRTLRSDDRTRARHRPERYPPRPA